MKSQLPDLEQWLEGLLGGALRDATRTANWPRHAMQTPAAGSLKT
jgi:hypothetical protein